MPDVIHQPKVVIRYWYGENEKKAKNDIAFIKDTLEKVKFAENKRQDHAEYVWLHPDEFCEKIYAVLRRI